MKKQIYYFVILSTIVLLVILFLMFNLEKTKEGLGASEAVICHSNLVNDLNNLNNYVTQNYSNDTDLISQVANIINHMNCIHGAVSDIGSNSQSLLNNLLNKFVSHSDTKQSINNIISSPLSITASY